MLQISRLDTANGHHEHTVIYCDYFAEPIENYNMGGVIWIMQSGANKPLSGNL